MSRGERERRRRQSWHDRRRRAIAERVRHILEHGGYLLVHPTELARIRAAAHLAGLVPLVEIRTNAFVPRGTWYVLAHPDRTFRLEAP